MKKDYIIPQDRPAFKVDEALKKAAKKAAKAFRIEEQELQKSQYART